MIVTSTPLEYAKSRLTFWEKRREMADRMEVKRSAGCFTSARQKRRELAVCAGAIAALKEIVEVEYEKDNP
jgi:hypothetical protein